MAYLFIYFYSNVSASFIIGIMMASVGFKKIKRPNPAQRVV